MDRREQRKRAGWSQDRLAVTAGTSAQMVKLFEDLPEAAARKVIPVTKYEAIERVYATLEPHVDR